MKRVILDTNAIMATAQFKIDVFDQLHGYDVFIVQGTLDELHQIMKEGKGKNKLAAKLGLQLLSAKKIDILPSEGHVDDVLVAYNLKGYGVLTQDVGLKRRLVNSYFTIRQKKYIIEIK
jgi:rRNA-processing protein FCF1